MASLRPGLRPGQGEQTRAPRATDNLALQDPGLARPPLYRNPESRGLPSPGSSAIPSLSAPSTSRPGQSRIPQYGTGAAPPSSAPRRPSDPRLKPPKPQSRPPLTHQSQSWATSMTVPSTARPSTTTMLPAASAPRYNRSGSASSVQSAATKSSGVRSRNNSAGTSSSSSGPRSQTPLDLDRGLTESPADLRIARKAEVTSAHTVTIYPELDRYRDIDILPSTSDGYGQAHPDILFRLATEGLPAPPTPYYSGTNSQTSAMSGSPSTRWSESPGPGPYSRDTTPTSISSHSPGLVASVRMPSAPRMRQPVRVRAGSFGKDSMSGNNSAPSAAPTHTLAAIRESLNSSSSSSNGTVRAGDKREKIKKKRLSPTPPSPPPRKSSQKFKKSDDEKEKESPAKHRTQPQSQPEPAKAKRPVRSKNTSTPQGATGKTDVGSSSSAPAVPSQQRHRTATSPQGRQQQAPPARPSRDGTPDLLQLDFPVPVIHSNLTHAPSPDYFEGLHLSPSSPPSNAGQNRPLYDRQRPGSPSYFQSVQPQNTTRSPSRQPAGSTPSQTAESKTVSSSPGPALSARSESRPAQEQAQAQAQAPSIKESGRTTRTPSPNVSNFRTRFPLFGRRTKTAPPAAETAAASEKKEASTRKGPAAGTGHEGYGRLGSGRRRSSSVSTFLRGTGSSQESLSSPRFQDPFLRDRLSPVVIAGGEVIENQNTGYDLSQTTSNTSISNTSTSASANLGARTAPYYRRPSTDSRADSVSSREDRLSVWPSAIPSRSRQASPFGSQGRRPSDSSDSEAVMKSTLAFRRSVQRLRSPDRAQVRVPRPIVVRPAHQSDAIPSSMTSVDMSIMSDDSIVEARPETGRGRKGSTVAAAAVAAAAAAAAEKPQPTAPRKLTKRARSPRKWNLFGRSHSQPASVKPALQSTSTVAVTVEAAAVPAEKNKPVAFYAMFDSSEQEDGDMDMMDVEDVLREARVLDSPVVPSSKPRDRRPSIEQTVFGSESPLRLLPDHQAQQSRATIKASTPPQIHQQQPPPPQQQTQKQQYRPRLEPSNQHHHKHHQHHRHQQPSHRDHGQQQYQERQYKDGQSRPRLAQLPQPMQSPPQPMQSPPQPPPPSSQQQQRRFQLSRSANGPVVQEVRALPTTQVEGPSAPLPPQPSTSTRQGRPSRLPQVGRIPKVVSARQEQTSPKSFSRPFNRASLQVPSSLAPLLNSLDTDSIAKGPSLPKSVTPELIPDGSTVTGSSADTTAPRRFRFSHNLSQDAEYIDRGNEFFSLSPRKDSQTTSSTSSSGLLSFADATAVVPDPSAPLVEDEIWDEYNDLLGDEAAKVPPSAGSSQGMPFHLEVPPVKQGINPSIAIVATAKQVRAVAPLESPTIVINLRPKRSIGGAAVRMGRPPVASSIYSVNSPTKDANDAGDAGDVDDADQRDSAFSQPPPTPFSVTDFVSGYGDRNNSGMKAKHALPSPRNSGSSQQSRKRKLRASNSSVYSQVSEDNSPISQVNLRVGSMTVSKWLTFGHVLFSPARDDMVKAVSPPNGHSVLVIDGLGNDDWSFYAAETYPAATFFNLSPRAPLPVDHQSGASAFPLSPPNHHQIQYVSHTDKLPFGPELFTTVVFRFPAAAPEGYYKNIVNEARRILKPGGYLELSILDLDLNNMGPRTRRAIRRLKEQIHGHTPDMHLGSAADAILRLLGVRGFTDIKSCRVGIPVASSVSQPGKSAASPQADTKDTKPRKDQRSLAEMINDESPVADESITSTVARVGRWWHSRCYGDAALAPSLRQTPNTTKSSDLWMDRALLTECEEWRTNLKLMVCYARVPDIKRVASI